MAWKNWPYWVKGGIIGFVIGIIFAIFNLFSNGYIGAFTLLPFLLLKILDNCYGEGCLGLFVYYGSIAFLVEFTLFGAIIGWIYGKIKKRKREV